MYGCLPFGPRNAVADAHLQQVYEIVSLDRCRSRYNFLMQSFLLYSTFQGVHKKGTNASVARHPSGCSGEERKREAQRSQYSGTCTQRKTAAH